MICKLCPRKCSAERLKTENLHGICGAPEQPKIARAALHFWEEPSISGKNGSGTIFFSGCPLKCVFCQNYDVSHNTFGKIISVNRLAEIFKELEDKGAHNINLVSPTHYTHSIIKALDIYRPKIPIVYNSGGYESTEQLRLLENYIDIYLLDFKYISSQKALRYSKAENYPEIAIAAIKEAYRQQSTAVFENGIMQKGVIIRHLLLPQSTNDAIRIFDWVKENAKNAYFSLMSQYIPFGNAESYPEINRRITKREYNKVLDYIAQSEFENCYNQELGSASESFIPEFKLEGV